MKKYPKTMRVIYFLLIIAVTVFFYRDVMPGGQMFNYFDTGEIGYVFLGPFLNYGLIWIPVCITILIFDKLVFKSDLFQWLNSY